MRYSLPLSQAFRHDGEDKTLGLHGPGIIGSLSIKLVLTLPMKMCFAYSHHHDGMLVGRECEYEHPSCLGPAAGTREDVPRAGPAAGTSDDDP